MRVYALYIVVAFLIVYAWKDWFKCLCALILMMAFIEHGDMPKSIFGVQGFNMWNVLFVGIFVAWLANRRREGLKWDMPRHINVLLLLYLGVLVIGFLRAVFDRNHIEHYTTSGIISEQLLNTIKWALPGLLLFDGCRSQKRLQWAVMSILGMYFLLAVQVIRRIPWSSALNSGVGGIHEARLRQCNRIGYSSCDMSAFLAGASWAMLAAIPLVRKRRHRFLILGAAGITAFGQALTGGRAGYAAWVATGLVLCMVRWRKYLIVAPAVLVLLSVALPGTVERMFEGFGRTTVSGQVVTDEYDVTSGRNVVWPYVIEKILESPVIGHGRLAMQRAGVTARLLAKESGSEAFPHPHNMYLELLLDNGVIGAIPIVLFFLLIITYSGRLFCAADPWCSAVGGLTLALVASQLFASFGSQHYYPRESTFGMWAAIFLLLRVHVERSRACTKVFNDSFHTRLEQPQLSNVAVVS